MKKVTSILFLIFPLSLNAQVALQGSYDGENQQIVIIMENDLTVAGFQFELDDVPDAFNITGASGGTGEEAGFTYSLNDYLVIAFSFSGGTIEPGIDTLCIIEISNPTDETTVSIVNPVFSSPGGDSIDPIDTGNPFTVSCTTTDDCGVCNGDNSDMDCDDVCFGDAVEDCLGVCNGTAVVDCDGMCEGTAALDECGVCNGAGPNYECWDESLACDIADCPTPPEEVNISFGEIIGNIIPIMIESYVPIAGFQAVLHDMPEAFDLTGISGGAAGNSGWVLNASTSGIILGFSMDNTPVLPTDGILFNLDVGNITGTYATLSLTDFVVPDGDGNAIESFTMGPDGFWGTMPDVPDAPTGLMVDNISGNSITLSWDASDLAEHYNVYRDGSLATSTGVTSFSDIDLEFDATYTYYVTAVNIAGESAASASVDATTDDAPPPPAPTNLMATSGDGEVGLAWEAPQMPMALTEGFESTNMPAGWQSIDNDNDNDDWDEWTPGYEYTPHSGSYSIASASWSPASGVPLNPDNWLISPSIDIVPGATLSYWVAAQDPSWSQEHIEVWVSTSGTNISDFDDEVDNYTCPAGSDAWIERMVDLNEYAGQSIHLAFRHTDVSDMFVIKLDDVSVTGAIGMAFNADFEDESDFSLFTHFSNPGYLPLKVEATMSDDEQDTFIQHYLASHPIYDDIPALNRMLVGYNIYRSETSGFGYVPLDGVGAQFTTYNDMSVTNGITYYYVVTGNYDPEGESEYSNEASATPSDFVILGVNVLTPIAEIGDDVIFEIDMTNDESTVHMLNFNLSIDPSSLDDVSINSTGRIPGSWIGPDPSLQGGVITISGHSDGTTGISAGTGAVYTVSGVVSENATSPIVNLVFSNITVGGENNSPLNIGEPVNGSFIIPGNLLPPEELEAQSGMDNQVQLTWDAPVTDYTPPECPDGSAEYVDCNGVCFNNSDCDDGANYDGCIFGDSTWLGDGFCDDGTWGLFFWLDGNECPEYGNDCGDCGAFDPNVDDPYDMCSGGGGGGGGDDDCASLDEFSLDNTGDSNWDGNEDGCFDDTDFGGTLGMTSYFTFSWNADCDASGIYFGYNDVNESYIPLNPPFTGGGPGLIYGFPSETGLVVMIESGSTLSDVESITTSSCGGLTASAPPQVINFNFGTNYAQPSASDKVLSEHHTIIPDFDMNEYSNQGRDSRDVDITSFNVYRSDDNASTFSMHATTEETTTAYLDTDVTNGSEYFYFVTAMYNDELESPASNQVSAIPSTWVTLSLTEANILSGTTGTVEVSLSNEEQVIGFQVDFADTPDNLTIISATATERVPGDWAISTAEQTDGTGRLVAFSFNSTSIEPGEGAVFVVEFEASATEPTDVALCTSNEVINYLSNDGSIEEFPVNSGCSNVLADVEGIEMAMTGPGGSVDQGDTFEVSFSAYIPYPVTACDIILEDIPEAVTIVGITGGSFVPPSAILSVSDDGSAHINGIFFPPLNPGEGELFTVTFQVNDDAEDGEEVTIEVSDETLFSDDSGNAMYWRDIEPYTFSSGAYDANLVLTWSTQTSFKVNLRNPSAEIYGFEFHVLDDPDNISFVSAEATNLIPPQPMPWMVQSNENNDGEIVVLGFDMTGVAPIEPSNELSAIVVVNYEWVGDADSTEICFTFTEAVDQLAQLYYVNDMSCAMLYNTLSMDETKPVPTQFELVQNHPNPFNPATTINFSIPEERVLSVKVYDLSGRHVKTVLNSSRLHVGHYKVIWDGTDKSGNSSAAGIYIYTLESRDLFLSKKMILMK